jgi:hypothetical protein
MALRRRGGLDPGNLENEAMLKAVRGGLVVLLATVPVDAERR